MAQGLPGEPQERRAGQEGGIRLPRADRLQRDEVGPWVRGRGPWWLDLEPTDDRARFPISNLLGAGWDREFRDPQSGISSLGPPVESRLGLCSLESGLWN